MVDVRGFDWDKGNVLKVTRHGLTIDEIERFFELNPFIFSDAKNSKTETRFIAFDKFDGKLLFVVFTLRAVEGRLNIRVISARYARKKEWKKFYGKI